MSGLIIPSARRCSSVGRRSPAPCATTSLQTFEPVLSAIVSSGLILLSQSAQAVLRVVGGPQVPSDFGPA
jgi:hypothetical protein